MAKKKQEEEQCGNWMDTYGDMVTLLLTFFVMLFSMSSVNEEKWQKLVLAFTNNGTETQQVVIAPEGEGDDPGTNKSEIPINGSKDSFETQEDRLPQDFDELYRYLKLYVEQNNMESSVEVSKGAGSVYVRFQDSVLFDPDSAVLKTSSFDLLNFLGEGLKSVEKKILTINIDGHTADPGIENYRISDWTLSGERAASVAIYFDDKVKLNPRKILPIGYGKNFPLASNDTAEGRRKNRRVDMMIISNEGDMSDGDILQRLLSGTFDPSKYPASGGTDILIPDHELPDSSREEGIPFEEDAAGAPGSGPASSDTSSSSSAPESSSSMASAPAASTAGRGDAEMLQPPPPGQE